MKTYATMIVTAKGQLSLRELGDALPKGARLLGSITSEGGVEEILNTVRCCWGSFERPLDDTGKNYVDIELYNEAIDLFVSVVACDYKAKSTGFLMDYNQQELSIERTVLREILLEERATQFGEDALRALKSERLSAIVDSWAVDTFGQRFIRLACARI